MVMISKNKKKQNILIRGLMLIFVMSTTIGCADNELSDLLEEEIVADDGGGVSGVVTYQNTAKALLDNACVRCHNATQANGGVRLHNFENASAVAASGRMIARMTSTGSPMPPSGNLPDPVIQDIINWIEDGILEN